MPRPSTPAEERFWSRVNKCESGCWEWSGGLDTNGYGRFTVDGKNMFSHRFSYHIHHPLTQPINSIKLFICHECDNPKCVNPDHLFLGTPQDNMTDKVIKGRAVGAHKGEKHHKAKLTESQVMEIRKRYSTERISYAQLAFEYGVNYKTIYQIINFKVWKHLTPLSPDTHTVPP
mgnify:CR=1 FL=1|jgi:hypothetical protein